MKKTSHQINLDNIDPKDFLTTLDNENKIRIEIADYSELSFLISSLIGVCQTTLMCFNDNQISDEFQKQEILGSSSLDVSNVLSLVKKLIPASEMNLLDIVKDEISN